MLSIEWNSIDVIVGNLTVREILGSQIVIYLTVNLMSTRLYLFITNWIIIFSFVYNFFYNFFQNTAKNSKRSSFISLITKFYIITRHF